MTSCTCGEVSFGEETRLPTEPNIAHQFDGTPCHYEPPSLMDIVEALGSVYDDKGAAIRLRAQQFSEDKNGHHPLADALWMVQHDRSQEVMDAIERLQSGAM